MLRTIFFCLMLLFIACKASQKATITNVDEKQNILDSLLYANDDYFKAAINNKDSLHLQIIYTKIDRDKNNNPTFTDYTFNTNHKNYFYPASTVKMPVAFLALEKINELKRPDLFNAAMITDSSFNAQDVVYNDPKSIDGSASIESYIKQIFLISDNNAFNRLYEFLGQEYINKKLAAKGFINAAIRHRLGIILNDEQNRNTNAVSFYNDSIKEFEQPAQRSNFQFHEEKVTLGNGYYNKGNLINTPFDFSAKNKIYLDDLHYILRSVLFPGSVSAKQKFNITSTQRSFLLKWMSTYPQQSRISFYDSSYTDAYVKFILLGGANVKPAPHIKVFNKSGLAYGFLTDIAYVIDTNNNIEFMVSATVLCNSDGIFNDDHYDYDNIGKPFFKHLGQIIYDYELKRYRKFKPDLSEFIFSTEKAD